MKQQVSPVMMAAAIAAIVVVAGGVLMYAMKGSREPSSVQMIATPAAAQNMGKPNSAPAMGGTAVAMPTSMQPGMAAGGAGYQNVAPVGK